MADGELIERLEKLERDNRRLKRLGLASLVLATALLAAYAASCSRVREMSGAQNVPEKIAAREFDLVDGSGRVRVRIDMGCFGTTDCWPGITLFDEKGKARTSIGAGTLSISGEEGEAELLDDVLQFNSGSKGAVSGVTARLGSDPNNGGALWLMGKGSSYAFVNSNPPAVEIQDSKGFMTDLGAADLTTVRTGETAQTSAASIVMFGNDKKHHVIWRAP
jgi:hypothetical protein